MALAVICSIVHILDCYYSSASSFLIMKPTLSKANLIFAQGVGGQVVYKNKYTIVIIIIILNYHSWIMCLSTTKMFLWHLWFLRQEHQCNQRPKNWPGVNPSTYKSIAFDTMKTGPSGAFWQATQAEISSSSRASLSWSSRCTVRRVELRKMSLPSLTQSGQNQHMVRNEQRNSTGECSQRQSSMRAVR